MLALLVVFLAGRIYESQRGPALHRWHTWRGNEMAAKEIDQATFAQYLAREKTIFADLQREVTDALPEEDKTPSTAFIATAGCGRDSLRRTGTVLLYCCRKASRAAAWCCSMA